LEVSVSGTLFVTIVKFRLCISAFKNPNHDKLHMNVFLKSYGYQIKISQSWDSPVSVEGSKAIFHRRFGGEGEGMVVVNWRRSRFVGAVSLGHRQHSTDLLSGSLTSINTPKLSCRSRSGCTCRRIAGVPLSPRFTPSLRLSPCLLRYSSKVIEDEWHCEWE